MGIMATLSAFIFAVGFRTFIVAPTSGTIEHLATGGISGLSQSIIIVCELFGVKLNYNTLQSIFYFVLNIPLLIFSFAKIGFRFSLFTTLNVALTSIFINYMPADLLDSISKILADQILARSLFAGICTGLSSAFAFKGNLSAGGVDIIGHYFASRKSTPTGKYVLVTNIIIISLFTALTTVKLYVSNNGNGSITDDIATALVTALFAVVYLFTSSLVIDTINVRNKKVQLQIISSFGNLYKVILSNLPHSCTIVKAKGGMSGDDKFIIYTVISSNEIKKTINFIKKIDPNSFITVTQLRQVYGNFFIKRVE